MLRSVIVFLVHIFSVIVFRVKLVGKENVPKEGAYIMCANHQSNWDAPILVSSTKRKMHVMAKEELFKNKFIYWLGDKCLVFPVKRGKMDLDSMTFFKSIKRWRNTDAISRRNKKGNG